jgi:hypothetical protein
MARRIVAPARVRQAALVTAIVLAMLEIGLFASAWRLGALLDPGNDRRAALGFIALGTALTLQAMVVVGVAWMLVAWSRTSLVMDDEELSLEHPWREWRGSWREVSHAWLQRRWLVLHLDGQWRRWYVHTGDAADAIDVIRAHVPRDAWLEGSDLRRHLARTVLPLFLAGIGVGGLVLVSVLELLNRALR